MLAAGHGPALLCIVLAGLAGTRFAQAPRAFTWQELRDKFEAGNPTLAAAKVSVEESKAQEITAYLRPNPNLTGTLDQINPFSTQPSPSGAADAYRPFAFALPSASISYLHERRNKRELRRETAEKSTAIAQSQLADQERTLLFNLRNAFVQTLQQKAVLALTRDSLAHYDRLLAVSRDRFKAGRHLEGGSGSPGAAARPVRDRCADRASQSAYGEDSASGAAE